MSDKLQQLQSLVGAVRLGLGVITKVGTIPSANLIPYVSTLTSAAEVAEALIDIGEDATSNIKAIRDTFSKPDVAPEDMAALDASIAAWRTKLHAPMPEKETDEPD